MWSGLALKMHLKVLCRFLCAGAGVGATRCQGVSGEAGNSLRVCERGYAEEGECNHPGCVAI